MPLRHSGESLPGQTVCTICRESFSERDDVLVTACSHRFHRNCLLSWLKRNSSCPQCRTACTSKDFHQNTGTRTRSRTAFQENPSGSSRNEPTTGEKGLQQQQSEGAASMPAANTDTAHGGEPSNGSDNETRIRNLVSAVISARQASMFDDLENRVTQIIENRLENTMASILERLNLNPSQPAQAGNSISPAANISASNPPPNGSTPTWPRDIPPLPNNSNLNFHNQIDQLRFSDLSSVPNIGRVAQLINSWDMKFDGTSRLSVDSFLSRIELQVIDALGGNFNLLCEHAQCLFTNEAKDWYWRYRRSVPRVTWPSLCEALRTNFQQHKSDFDIKESIRARKQGQNECFDDFRNAILKIAESLQTPLSERELVETMQRNLRPVIRQQLLFVPVNSLAELRKLCIRGESLANEIAKSHCPAPTTNLRQPPRRQINEVQDDSDLNHDVATYSEFAEVDAVAKQKPKLKSGCWNCNKEGHRYFDCLEERTVFCYGCGAPNVYRPKCSTCSQGNSKMSEEFRQNPRNDSKH